MNLLFIITGSIAVIKCEKILSNLRKKKISVDCIITQSAKKLLNTNLIKSNISGNIYFDTSEKKNKMLHIRLARKCDLIVVCPATANSIAKFAHGYANDLASTTLMASNKQVMFMPAMNVEMWSNRINSRNVKILKNLGVEFVGPDYGKLSCGEFGYGRLEKENKISNVILEYLTKSKKLTGKKILVTAGPTIEPIDSVRYLSNYSSGKQGYEIAKQLKLAGANVILITGPTNIQAPTNIKMIKVTSAKEMYKSVKSIRKIDIAIFSAAVSDFKPKKLLKYKKTKNRFKKIDLTKNLDIVKTICNDKKNRPRLVVAFAAETNNLIEKAKIKLKNKGCDWIIGNEINNKNKVFGSDYNKIVLISNNNVTKYKKMTKINIAKIITEKIIQNNN